MGFLERRLAKAANILLVEFRKELRNQGHEATRKLARSLQANVLIGFDSATIEVYAETYAVFVNDSTKGHFPNLDKIYDWVVQKGLPRTLSGRKSRAKSLDALRREISYAIAYTIFKQGLPTKNSYRYSKNGYRTNFIDRALKSSRYLSLLDDSRLNIELVNTIFQRNTYNL